MEKETKKKMTKVFDERVRTDDIQEFIQRFKDEGVEFELRNKRGLYVDLYAEQDFFTPKKQYRDVPKEVEND